MKRIYFPVLLNVWAAVIIAQSPITLGNSNMPGSGDTLRYTNFTLASAGNYTQTGINFNWNFSQVTSTTEGVRKFESALLTPYSILFLSLSEYGEKLADTIGAGPLVLTNYYNFYKKQGNPNAFIADGVGLTFSSVPIPSYYSDKDELYNFPMSYPKSDSSTFKFTTTTAGLIPVSYSKVGYRITKVDGWGTITTPYGTENCLRLVTTQYAMDSIKNTILPIPLGFPNYQRSYQWLTLTSKIPYLEITGNLVGSNFTPTVLRYRGYSKSVTGIQEHNKSSIRIFPNPVKNSLYLDGISGLALKYQIFGPDGKAVLMAGETEVFESGMLDVSRLTAGVYFIALHSENEEWHLKFIKE